MNVLVLFESSGVVRDAFIRAGHNAVSVDLLPSSSELGNHFTRDVEEFLERQRGTKYDLIIAHPPCTALCVSGNHVYAKGKERFIERANAINYVEGIWNTCCMLSDRVCFENPVGVLPTMSYLPQPQYIQPYNFGEDASKKTGLFLRGLPRLTNTKRVDGRWVGNKERWANQTDSGQNRLGPSEERWKERSKTYQGLANAMASQWLQ